MLGGPGNDVVPVRTLTVIQISMWCRLVPWPVTRLDTASAKNSTNTTVTNTTLAKSGTIANSTTAYSTLANYTATDKSSLAAVYGFQVSIGQFNFPNRVFWEGTAFLFAQALTIRFVFPRAYDVDVHLYSPFSVLNSY